MNDQLRALLQQLKTELADIDDLDQETLAALSSLDTNIDLLLKKNNAPSATLIATATKLETRFATEYPLAESVLRNIVDSLAKMGV